MDRNYTEQSLIEDPRPTVPDLATEWIEKPYRRELVRLEGEHVRESTAWQDRCERTRAVAIVGWAFALALTVVIWILTGG